MTQKRNMIDIRPSEDTSLPGFELPQYMGPLQRDWVSEQRPDMKLDTHTGVAQGPNKTADSSWKSRLAARTQSYLIKE